MKKSEIEWNEMYLSNGKEKKKKWNRILLSYHFWMF